MGLDFAGGSNHMRRVVRTGVVAAAVLLYLGVAHDSLSVGRAQTPAAPAAAAQRPVSPQQALVDQYCMGCHSDRGKAGGLALSALDLDAVSQHPDIAEKVIRKLRGGLMPPAGSKRPDNQAAAAFVTWLETEIDKKSVDAAPGRVPLRRLNRREYANAVRDLVGLNIDAKALLPDDNIKGHFDNDAGALQVSPNFIDQYIYAARAVALDAVGNPKAPPVTTTYGDVADMVISLPPSGAPGTGRQQHRLPGMPFGTRGGFVVEHNFPADGQYELTIGDMALAREVPRMEFENTVVVLLDGKEFYRTNIGGDADHKAIDQQLDPAVERINARLRKIPFTATAGQHTIGVTFVHRTYAESDERTRTVALEGGQERIQAVHALEIRGPLKVTGMSLTGSRGKIFICTPKAAIEEAACAQKIVDTLARRAFRRPVTAEDTAPLMAFYKAGRATGSFDAGVRDALGAILASPHFLYRAEGGGEERRQGVPGDAAAARRPRTLTDLELASRLSFFIWSSIPDDELLKVATESRLSQPAVLNAQVTRMLADPRARSLSEDFAFQWLNLAKLDTITPDRGQFPHASGLLDQRELLKEELRLFIDSVLRSDRSVMELLTAEHTFLNERLAMLYGIETVKGPNFRRVTIDQTMPGGSARRGLLGKGAVLMLTAYPNRTSPVLRGAWILDRLLGTPPSDPPLNVPDLPENRRGQPAKSLRARLEQHRANPTCFSCHGVMDPLGLSLENFNAVGQYRNHDPDTLGLIDTVGKLPDGTEIKGPEDLRKALTERPDHQFVQAFTENLLTYGLGRSLDHRDMPTVRRIVRQAAADRFRFKSLVLGVVSSDAFRKREGVPATPAPNTTASNRGGK
jgi:mono/diheme cytochrome c family protein